MKKIYVLKLSNKEGKEIFKGVRVKKIFVNNKEYNLVGSLDNLPYEEVIVCSAITQKELQYGIVGSYSYSVDDKTKHSFMVLK